MSQRRPETRGSMMMDHTDYPYLFDEWLKGERKKLRTRTKGFVGDRRYRHFDGRIDITDLESNLSKLVPLLKNPELLVKHAFYPFIRKDQKVRLYRTTGIGQKIRPIMYASHADACIYGFYAYILKQYYEQRIKDTPLSESVIAYRKLPREDVPDKGKSNIDLAKEVFDLSRKYDKCAVLCLDIENFFDTMDHKLIKEKWANVIDNDSLPAGHYAVYKNITTFRYTFLHQVLESLGYGRLIKGKFIYKPNKRRKGLICYPSEFNNKVDSKVNSLVHKNHSSKGIPQGSPISDIIANLYLENFDSSILESVAKYEFGHYRRYSDDIFIICPENNVDDIYKLASTVLKKEKLNIKPKKSEVFLLDFQKHIVQDLTFKTTSVKEHETGHKQAFQYLGFEIDTKDIHLRSGTVAAHYRRAKRRANIRKKPKTDSSVKTRKNIGRQRHWQYMIRSKEKLESSRIERQVHKVIKRAKKF